MSVETKHIHTEVGILILSNSEDRTDYSTVIKSFFSSHASNRGCCYIAEGKNERDHISKDVHPKAQAAI